MLTVQNAYQKALLEARGRYLDELMPDVLEALAIEYAFMLDRVARDFTSGIITAERADELFLSIIDHIVDLVDRLDGAMSQAMLEAINVAIEGHASGIGIVSERAGQVVTASFASVPGTAIEGMMVRRGLGGASTFRTLINRHLVQVANEVDSYLTSAVSRGVSGQRGAVELARILSRNDPEVLSALNQFNGALAKAVRAGVDEDVALRASMLLYDSRRIVVTETNTAYFEADRVSSIESPVVDLVFWQVSGRHFGLSSSPDVCSNYHLGDFHGFGPGLFHPANAPSKPHPFCACNLLAQTRPPSAWNDPKRPIPEPVMGSKNEIKSLLERASNRVLARGIKPRELTEKHLKRQRRITNEGLQFAHEAVLEAV